MAKLAEKTDYPAYGVTGPNPLHCADKGPVSRPTICNHQVAFQRGSPTLYVTKPSSIKCLQNDYMQMRFTLLQPIDLNLTRNAEVYHYQQQKKRLKKISRY